MKINRRTGEDGEAIAKAYLKDLGYEVLHANWRHRHCEVDIIARDGTMIVFVEVKTRSSACFGQPEAFVDKKKAGNLMKAADEFLTRFSEPTELRFDIVAVTLDKTTGEFEVEYFPDAFYW